MARRARVTRRPSDERARDTDTRAEAIVRRGRLSATTTRLPVPITGLIIIVVSQQSRARDFYHTAATAASVIIIIIICVVIGYYLLVFIIHSCDDGIILHYCNHAWRMMTAATVTGVRRTARNSWPLLPIIIIYCNIIHVRVVFETRARLPPKRSSDRSITPVAAAVLSRAVFLFRVFVFLY